MNRLIRVVLADRMTRITNEGSQKGHKGIRTDRVGR